MVKSTRSEYEATLDEAIIESMAPDGGLFVLENIPQIDITTLIRLDYIQIAKKILGLLLDDYGQSEIDQIVDSAYQNKFSSDYIATIRHYHEVSFLELFHGPTLSFKDYGLLLLPHLIERAKCKKNMHTKHIVLTATSGDTGSATLSSFWGIEDIKTIVFYPYHGVSAIQEKQMLHFQSQNQFAIGIDGNFDDAQRFVKRMFKQYPQLLSANSINLGRLIPQTIYYFHGYLEMVRKGKIKIGDLINVSVPTGNFGNIYAAYLAKKMGLPFKMLICASNENNSLTKFFETGIYDISKPLITTNSPSMDIILSSNLERLLYDIGSVSCVNDYITQLTKNKRYTLPQNLKTKLQGFYGVCCYQEEVIKWINRFYYQNEIMIDPHTAVAYGAYHKYRNATGDCTKTMIVSTAHWTKFIDTIKLALPNENINSISSQENWQEKQRIIWKKDEMEEKFNELYGELLC